jgi:hypothetical protein
LFAYGISNVLGIVDVSNPIKPSFLCTLSPAQGGRFIQSRDTVAFWTGDRLGSVDLSTGKVVQTGRLPQTPFEGFFSRDGAMFGYRAGDSAGRIYTNINSGSLNRTLYTQEPLGGHGGTPWGPVDQLEFSPDGSELLDFFSFRPPSGPDNFLVYRTANILTSSAPSDSFLVVHSTKVVDGVWSPTGNALYFYGPLPPPDTGGQLFSLDPSGQTRTAASGLNNMFWPRMAPQGGNIVYTAIVSTGPGDQCGGLPHLWSVDLATGHAMQLTFAVSSEPVFVSQTVAWSAEEVQSQCGPGGESTPDGLIVAYDLAGGTTKRVDMTDTVPGVGAPQPSTSTVIDVWL